MLTSTLRQGPIYTYNIFSLLQEDSVLKIGEEVNLPRKNGKRARARAKIAKFIFRHRRL